MPITMSGGIEGIVLGAVLSDAKPKVAKPPVRPVRVNSKGPLEATSGLTRGAGHKAPVHVDQPGSPSAYATGSWSSTRSVIPCWMCIWPLVKQGTVDVVQMLLIALGLKME